MRPSPEEQLIRRLFTGLLFLTLVLCSATLGAYAQTATTEIHYLSVPAKTIPCREINEGKIILQTEAGDSFLGLYKPKDRKDGLLDLPGVGIGVLDVIPAMRNKFHATDEIGPQSQPNHVSGIKRGIIHFRFGEQ